jgi:hypothetical protein
MRISGSGKPNAVSLFCTTTTERSLRPAELLLPHPLQPSRPHTRLYMFAAAAWSIVASSCYWSRKNQQTAMSDADGLTRKIRFRVAGVRMVPIRSVTTAASALVLDKAVAKKPLA